MPILLKTRVKRTAKTLISARRARVGGLCGFRSTAERRTHPAAENRTLCRCAGAVEERQEQKKGCLRADFGRGRSRKRRSRRKA